MKMIIPAILVDTTEKLLACIKRIETELPNAEHIHIDIMDGHFVETKSMIDPTVLRQASSLPNIELHLMVKDPIAYMRAWQEVDTVFRVLVHHESPGDPQHLVNFARKIGWDVGVVLNPETPLQDAEKYLTKIDVLQFMIVHPGVQGAPFVSEVISKIENFTANIPTCEYSQKPVVCSVDGHVAPETIKKLDKAGADIFNVGSFLLQAADMKKAYDELQSLVR